MTDFRAFSLPIILGIPWDWGTAEADEEAQSKAMLDAVASCLDALEHFVVSSLPDPEKVSKAKHTLARHHTGKAGTVECIKSLRNGSL